MVKEKAMTDERPKHELQDPAEQYKVENEVTVEPVTPDNDESPETTHPEDDNPQKNAGEFADGAGSTED